MVCGVALGGYAGYSRHRWDKARLRGSRWARPSSVAQRRRKGREEQRSSDLWLKTSRTLGAQAVGKTTKWEELPTLSTNTRRRWESATAGYTKVKLTTLTTLLVTENRE